MKGIVIYEDGDSYVRKLEDNLTIPIIQKDEILIETHYGGLNFADLMMCNGTYPHPKGYPLKAGLELSGIVTECGDDVKEFIPGDRVVGFSEDAGAFSEFCKLKSMAAVKVMDSISLSDAAAYFVQATTAYHLLHTIGKINSNDTILVHAVGGGVGLNLVQLAKFVGAKVIGTVGTSGKEIKPYDCGADLVIDRNKSSFVKEINQKYGDNSIDILIDSTGAEILDASFNLMKKLAHVISYGEASGKPYNNLWEKLVEKSLTFSRLHIGHMDFFSSYWIDAQYDIQNKISKKELIVYVEKIFELDDFDNLYNALGSRNIGGKLLLKFK